MNYRVLVRPVEAHYEDCVLRPMERLAVRPGERVQLIVVRRPDPSRWNVDKLATTVNGEDLALAEESLADWAEKLEGEDRR
jgi:predicted DNA-binding antitoxin AbrB/MazE fold protein